MLNWRIIEELKEKMKYLDIEAAVDFDEKLWDLHCATEPFIRKIYGVSVKKEDITYWEYMSDRYPRIKEAWNNWDIYKQGKPIQGSQDYIKALKYIFGPDRLKIVTATFPDIIVEKEQLIKETYGVENVIHTAKKYEHTKNALLFDDALHNIKAHVEHNNMYGFIFDRNYGWNQEKIEDTNDKIFRVHSYEEQLFLLNSLY